MIRPNDILLDTTGNIVDQLRINSQQIVNDLVVSLGVTGETEAIKETLKIGNSFTLANGEYGGWTSQQPGTVYKALGAGSRITRQVIISRDCIVDGVHFVGGPSNKEALVFVGVGATVVFRNCIFEKQGGDPPTYLSLGVPSGGVVARANLIGCVFQGPNVGAVVNNPGAAANVNTIGCHDKTGGGFAGTTGVGNL